MRIPSIEEVFEECHEDCGCLIWHGGVSKNNHPKIADMSGRRFVYQAVKKVTLRKTQLVTVTCGERKCLNPDHLKLTTKAEVSKNNQRNPATRAKSILGIKKANMKNAKINMDIARMIRADPRSGLELAKELNVSPDLISLVRTNKSWKEVNPFQGLMR